MENQNSYTNLFQRYIPRVVQEEFDFLQFLGKIGLDFYQLSQAAKRLRKHYELIPPTRFEVDAEERKGLMQYLQVKANFLALATLIKVLLSYFAAGLGVLAEFFIYQSIAENALGLSSTKSVFIGLTVVMFTKFIQLAIQKHIKVWIKESNILLRSLHKKILFVFVGLIFLNAMMLGIINLNQIKRLNKIDKIEYLSSTIAEAEEYGEDVTELETELNQLQTDINKKENWFISFIKFISIVLMGLLSIGCGAVLFCIADLYADAWRLKKKIQALKNSQARHRANFQYFQSTFDDLVSLQKEILQLYGHKHFLEKLLSAEKEEDLKIPQE